MTRCLPHLQVSPKPERFRCCVTYQLKAPSASASGDTCCAATHPMCDLLLLALAAYLSRSLKHGFSATVQMHGYSDHDVGIWLPFERDDVWVGVARKHPDRMLSRSGSKRVKHLRERTACHMSCPTPSIPCCSKSDIIYRKTFWSFSLRLPDDPVRSPSCIARASHRVLRHMKQQLLYDRSALTNVLIE